MLNVRIGEAKRLALWLGLGLLAALLTYFAFRGYLGSEFLLNFSSGFTC